MTMTPPSAEAHEDAIRVHVPLGERAYDILIGRGLLDTAGARIAPLGARRAAIVSDETVAPLYADRLIAGLAERGIGSATILMPPGEASKSYESLARVCDAVLAARVERGDLVIALGGGVIGDLAGFAASILRRGVRLVQIPTTLLAQVDSSVGGKTGIDTPQGKNLIGTFHQPSLVLADISTLSTLPEREFRAGYAEVAKYGLLGDAAFFAWLEQNWKSVFSGKGEERRKAIETSIRAKAAIVEADEREESGTRALLNLGHTFGHALEAFAGYSDRLLHGEAISIGMRLAFTYSVEQGLCSAEDAARVERHFETVGLPVKISDIAGKRPSTGQLLRLMAQDKKVKGGALTFILARGIGQSFIARDVPVEKVRVFLSDENSAPRP